MPNVSNSRVGTNTNPGFNGVRLNQSTTSHSAQVSQARTDVQRLQGSITSPTPDQSNSTQNGASLLDVGTGTTTSNPTSTTAPTYSHLPFFDFDHIIYVDPVTGEATCGGPQPETPSLTNDQKNQITNLLTEALDENNSSDLYDIAGGIARITGDRDSGLYPAVMLSPKFNPVTGRIEMPDRLTGCAYNGITGQIIDQFQGEQKRYNDDFLLPLGKDTIKKIMDYVQGLPTTSLETATTAPYTIVPGDKASNYSQFFADYNKSMTILIDQLSSPGPNGEPIIDGVTKSLLQDTQMNIAKHFPPSLDAKSLVGLNATDEAKMISIMNQIRTLSNNIDNNKDITANDLTSLIGNSNALGTTLASSPRLTATSLSTAQKDPILKLIKNRILENIMGVGENGNISRDKSLDGLVGEIATILGDQATTTSYTGISGQIMDKFKDQQKYDADGAPLGLSTATLKQMYSFIDNLAGGKSSTPNDTEAIAQLNLGAKDIETRIKAVESGKSNEDIEALKSEQFRLQGALRLYKEGISSISDGQETQTDAVHFSAFKISFYKNQTKGLDDLLKQWQDVKDDTGYARAQIGQIKSQQASTSAAQSFFSSQQDFWTDESAVQYQDKDMAQVQSIYNKIKEVEVKYDKAVTEEGGNREGVSSANKELLGLKAQLTTIRGSETKQPTYKDPNSLGEGVYSQFRVDSLTERDEALQKEQKQLIGKHKSVKGKKNKAQLVEIMNERREIASAKKFWSQQAEFWNKLGDAGFSDKDQDQIDGLTSKLLQLEIDMDQVSSGDATNKTEETEETKKTKKGQASSGNTSAANRAQIKIINTKIAEIKAQITDLHTEI